MPKTIIGRTLLAVGLLAAAALTFFTLARLIAPGVRWAKDRTPGTGPAGSMRLVYEIKMPADAGVVKDRLARQVMESLKKRVDPSGVRNIAWRLQSENQLEITVPLSNKSKSAAAAREACLKAATALDQTNIRLADVRHAVEELKGQAREQALEKLAQGYEKRQILFRQMTAAYDRIGQAEATSDFRMQAEAEVRYENLQQHVRQTNLTPSDFEASLHVKPAARAARLSEMQQSFAGFQARLDAMTQFEQVYAVYQASREFDDVGELKRLIKGSGVLSFHIMVTGQEVDSPLAREMRDRLRPGGRGTAPQANDQIRWFEVERPDELRGQTVEYDDKLWALAWVTPEKSMVNRAGQPRWALESAYPATDQMGLRAVGFEFNAEGAARFGELTAANINQTLGAMLDDKIISAATVNSVISRAGIITRSSGYTDADFLYLINTLNAGSLPAQLSEQPISEQTVAPQPDAR